MKAKFYFLGLFLVSALFSFSQKKFSEGTINYDIVINTNSDKTQNADFFDGATSVVYLKGGKSRSEIVNTLGTQSTIIDGAKNSYTILREYGDQKYMINMTSANWLDLNRKYAGLTFTYTDETKTILGYNCKRAIAKLGDGSVYSVWYTTDLVPENKEFETFTSNLPGLAMQYEASMGKANLTYTVSKISFNPVPAAKFDLPKSGFRVLTYEESKGRGK